MSKILCFIVLACIFSYAENSSALDTENISRNALTAYRDFQRQYSAGDLPAAKFSLAIAIQSGYEMQYWDHAAMADILVFEGRKDIAFKKLDYAVTQAFLDCEVEPRWKKIRSRIKGLNAKNWNALKYELNETRLVRFEPTQQLFEHKQTLFSGLVQMPREFTVELDVAIDQTGKIQCISPDPDDINVYFVAKSLRKFKLDEARDHTDTLAWTYGVPFNLHTNKEVLVEFNEAGEPVPVLEVLKGDAITGHSAINFRGTKNQNRAFLKKMEKRIMKARIRRHKQRRGVVTVEDVYDGDPETENEEQEDKQ